ncbi:hypothetical protein Tco_0222949 [Tanacetum coccineum]
MLVNTVKPLAIIVHPGPFSHHHILGTRRSCCSRVEIAQNQVTIDVVVLVFSDIQRYPEIVARSRLASKISSLLFQQVIVRLDAISSSSSSSSKSTTDCFPVLFCLPLASRGSLACGTLNCGCDDGCGKYCGCDGCCEKYCGCEKNWVEYFSWISYVTFDAYCDFDDTPIVSDKLDRGVTFAFQKGDTVATNLSFGNLGPIRRIHQGRYGVSVHALTKDHKRNEDQYAVSKGLNTPYSRYGINIIFWKKIFNVILIQEIPNDLEYDVSTFTGYGVSSSFVYTEYSVQLINTVYPLPLDTAYRLSGTETKIIDFRAKKFLPSSETNPTDCLSLVFRHFKTLSLDELRSPDFNLLSDEEYSEEEEEEEMTKTMEQ